MVRPTDAILIYTNTFDPHADGVIDELRSLGVGEIFRLNTDEVPSEIQVDIAPDARCRLIHRSGRILDTARVRSLWIRRPGLFGTRFESDDTDPHSYFQREWQATVLGLLASLDCLQVNRYDAGLIADSKIQQLTHARRTGMAIPPTLVSNRPDQVRQFVTAQRELGFDVVCKVVHSANVNVGQQMLRTTVVDDALLEHADDLAHCPMIFQRRIPKQYELRVTVIGTRVYAARIDSQQFDETSTDWRVPSVDVPLHAHPLPDPIADWCRTFMQSYGLQYSAFDFIVTPDGDFVFVENNPGGQFGFIEHAIPEFPLAATMAQLLAGLEPAL